MNFEAVLALISNLYEQLVAAQQRVEELEALGGEASAGTLAADAEA